MAAVFHLLSASTVIEDDEDPEIPISLWYEIYLWLDQVGLDLEPQERIFRDKNLLMLVQMNRGELRYAFGGRPRSWVWVEDL